MNHEGTTESIPPATAGRVARTDRDRDWEYTGEFFICFGCGHEFREPPYDIDICPECGADFWQDEDRG